jgi:excisionase family DNA binding protein
MDEVRRSARPKRTVEEREVVLLTDEEVADQLACTARRVRQLFYDKQLAGVYVGVLLRFKQSEVDAFIERNVANGPRSKVAKASTLRRRPRRT